MKSCGFPMEQYRYWLALKKVPGIGNVLCKRLVETFGGPEAVFRADLEALATVEGISEETARSLLAFSAFSEIDVEFERVSRAGARLLCLHDPEYPKHLTEIYDPPPLLYVKGKLTDAPCVAIVGSRTTTPYGRAVAEQMARGLAGQGITVVSGFARGIDGVAHRAALAAGGETVAVLGCGVDRIYPPEHRALHEQIVAHGAMLSEFPMGTPPEPHHFPQRNRILSGLSLGCVVVEAPEASGSMITARHAVEQGREVFAVPGPITSPSSAGPHRLIRDGATLVRNVSDIFAEILPHLAGRSVTEAPLPPLEPAEEAVFRLLSLAPKQIDQIIQESGQTVSAISGTLLALELKGAVRLLPGQFYVRA
jgi:DNA processing protein